MTQGVATLAAPSGTLPLSSLSIKPPTRDSINGEEVVDASETVVRDGDASPAKKRSSESGTQVGGSDGLGGKNDAHNHTQVGGSDGAETSTELDGTETAAVRGTSPPDASAFETNINEDGDDEQSLMAAAQTGEDPGRVLIENGVTASDMTPASPTAVADDADRRANLATLMASTPPKVMPEAVGPPGTQGKDSLATESVTGVAKHAGNEPMNWKSDGGNLDNRDVLTSGSGLPDGEDMAVARDDDTVQVMLKTAENTVDVDNNDDEEVDEDYLLDKMLDESTPPAVFEDDHGRLLHKLLKFRDDAQVRRF